MLGTLRLRQDADEDVEPRRAAYHIAMADLPLFAIEEACTAAFRAQTGDRTGRYAPSPGELHKAAERAMEPILREKADITKILLAKVIERPTPEQRAASIANVRSMVRDVLEDIAMKNAPKVAQPDEIKAAAEARLAEMEAEVARQKQKEDA